MRIGIIGAGQLGQMLGFAARKLGLECRFVDPSDNPPAADCGDVIRKPFDDADALADLAATCDVVTYEFENVPVEALSHIEGRVPVHPPAAALQYSQDRLDEKQLFAELEIPLSRYRKVDSREDIDVAVDALGLPIVIKTRRLGYDGKGQFIVRSQDDCDAAWQALGGNALIAEAWVSFDFEVSCIGVRNVEGDVAIYPLARNVHIGGILHTSCSPVDAPGLAAKAEDYVRRLLDRLDYVGTLALELFVCGEDLFANEFAPRVHNSGHWSIEGSATSQFENHIRAVLGRPLGSTAPQGHSGMVNLIGEITDEARNLDVGVLHDYGKSPRPGRKLGHITVTAETAEARDIDINIIERCVTAST
jgi:5-(carboxyamino)imidazole ribonucleotide synthase